MKRKKRSKAYLLVWPALLLSIVLIMVPGLLTIVVSFTDWNGVASLNDLNFVGLQNFQEVFSNKVFWKSFYNNLEWTAIYLTIPVAISVFVAALLINRKHTRSLYQVLFLIPYVLAPAVNAMLWKSIIFNPSAGMVGWLRKMGYAASSPLGSMDSALFAVAAVDIWHYWGYLAIVYLASMRQTPDDQIEVARVMGCNALQVFRYVYYPNMRATFRLMFIMIMITSFLTFDYVWLLTSGGPAHATEMLSTYAYSLAYSTYQTGKAAVVSLFAGGFGMIASCFYTALSRKEEAD
ncbi:carbohydrate ABC transporter permease [Diplocloster modestus]|uniref:Sugar ABC transporter permease n=1 Tax=Diplocloster modestus TaxID=2850322 RepID=A0ABS6K947_9FIRM|nr:sugar ABC transporter permease [Diplocloster modestus]MBU9727032.1 sugar ABC transporter permease [Diplocloster modestus]